MAWSQPSDSTGLDVQVICTLILSQSRLLFVNTNFPTGHEMTIGGREEFPQEFPQTYLFNTSMRPSTWESNRLAVDRCSMMTS